MIDWDSIDESIPAPVEIAPILEYSMRGAAVPDGVTVSGGETISSRRIEDVQFKDEDGEWKPL